MTMLFVKQPWLHRSGDDNNNDDIDDNDDDDVDDYDDNDALYLK